MKQPILSIILTGFCCCATAAQAQGGSLPQDEIGVFTAVLGTVNVTHPGAARVQPVKLHDEILFKDVIETHDESRTKAFFEDDSVLTVGENSRVEITEHIYNPDQNQRRMVVNLIQGKLRALVSKVFKGAGSKFEIHTPTAVAAARGTYFVVWTEHGTTGIANIGESGRVDFTAGGITVTVAPGEYSVVGLEGHPTPPAIYDAGSKENGRPAFGAGFTGELTAAEGTTPPPIDGKPENVIGKTGEMVNSTMGTTINLVDQSVERLIRVVQAIEGTVLKDMPKPESAIEIVRAIFPVLPISPTAATGTVMTIAGTTSPALGQIILESSAAPDGSVPSLAAATTSTLSSTFAPVASTLTAVTSALAPVTSLVSTVVAPVTPVVSTVLAPVTPVVSAVVSPITAVVATPVAPVTTVIAPVISAVPILPPVASTMPVAAATPVLPVTPPAVISGVTGALGLPIK
ncbi:FecR domain-containing protein [Nitrospira sp. Nam80]